MEAVYLTKPILSNTSVTKYWSINIKSNTVVSK